MHKLAQFVHPVSVEAPIAGAKKEGAQVEEHCSDMTFKHGLKYMEELKKNMKKISDT